jgi:hypothetical protein
MFSKVLAEKQTAKPHRENNLRKGETDNADLWPKNSAGVNVRFTGSGNQLQNTMHYSSTHYSGLNNL